MVTDVHCYIERRHRDPDGMVGPWTYVALSPVEQDELESLCYGRWDLLYLLTGKLGRTYAGSFEHAPWSYAARGVPRDASPEYRAVLDKWQRDAHSETFVTLAELLAYDWGSLRKRGVVDPWGYLTWQPNPDNEPPHQPCMPGEEEQWNLVSREAMDRLVAEDRARLEATIDGSDDEKPDDLISVRCLVTWPADFHRAFLERGLPFLQRFGAPEHVRLLLFCDN